jgi:hypothetical protein
MNYRTQITAKAELVEPGSNEFKAVASYLEDKYGFELKPQMDLLYTRACLVSAGPSVGVNDNDDIFTREAAWAARHTPVMKPMNWQHNDKDILGVIYSVQARDLDGNVLDITDDTPPDSDFDLWVEAAVFRLIHEDRAGEIETRAKSGQLYVSMEAWFDDYNYGFCDKATGSLTKVVSRDKNTSFLDRQLKAGGGRGVYRDPDTNQDMRIGRVLGSITFGGCGFVDRPANKRSKIDSVETMSNSLAAELNTDSQIKQLLEMVEDFQPEETLMNTQANSGQTPDNTKAADLEAILDRREKAAAERQEQEALVGRAQAAEDRNQELEAKVAELSEQQASKETQVEELQSQLEEYSEAVNELVKEQATAGATNDTPSEIARIDGVTDGDSAFDAKIAWIQQSMASLRARAQRADELEAQLAEAEAVVREQDVRVLLGEAVSEQALETFVAHAASLDADAYEAWRDEKELMVLEMSRAMEHGDKEDKAKGKDMPPALKEQMMKKKKESEGMYGKDKAMKDAKANVFEALLQQRRAESGMATMDTMRDNPNEPDLINHPGDGTTDVRSGVNPGSIRTPRHKVAGSAGNDPAEMLEYAQEQGGVSLAGSQAHDEGEGPNPFRSLANLVASSDEGKETESQEGPGFDPVR